MITSLVTTLASVFFVVNPLGNAPIYLGLVEGHSQSERRSIVRRAALTVVVVLTLFAVIGQQILGLFNISFGALRIAGGIILFGIASKMLQAEPLMSKSRPEEASEALEKPDISIVPLAIPMLAGPGAITTILVLASNRANMEELGILIVAIALSGVAIWLVLGRAGLFLRVLGQTGINVFTRIMGLLLAAIAVQFVIVGLGEAAKLIAGRL